ncbi:MAG: hypothetical protein EBS98_09245 [Chitinophagia bacterium]|jgi:hypothetical protein|nr:hypothetical protein [Chitinophagia bacterium]
MEKRMSYEEREIKIGEVKMLLEQGYSIEVDSPDGFVPVSLFVDKGRWEEYCLELDNGEIVRVNQNHLFETDRGWKYAKDIWHEQTIVGYVPYQYLCTDGWHNGRIKFTGNTIPIVDIQVEHENHRYYTNGVSSHNTGVGKSLAMCHFAAYNLIAGKNVLYITLEMAEERIAERIDANLLNVAIDELSLLPKEIYLKKIEKIKSKTPGRLIIKEYPTGAAGANNFRFLINELKLKKSFVPDIIYVDYLNICMSSRLKLSGSVNSYSYIKAIAEELRGLAVECDLPIVTATQVNRTGFTSSDIGLEDTSESFGLPATADLMFALISTEELADLNQIMVKQLKSRYSDINKDKRFVVGIDRAKMKLYNVEQSAQEDIVDDTRDKRPAAKNKFKPTTFEDFN